MNYSKSIGRFLALAAAVMMIITLPVSGFAATVPSYDAALTDQNMILLMEAYDSDAAYILKAMNKAGDSFSEWMSDSENLVDAADTTVHEEFHGYTSYKIQEDRFYMGDETNTIVPRTTVFTTYEATQHILEEYRTFRYDTYVSESSTASSNLMGVYGLLNEFCAYYWGMHAMKSLYPYILKEKDTADEWHRFFNCYANNRNAYTEFYYYTLVYLKYAKENYPAIYQSIIGNELYVTVFCTMQQKFESLIREYEQDLEKVSQQYNGSSFAANFRNGFFWINNRGTGTNDDYSLLAPLINSDDFREIRNALGSKLVVSGTGATADTNAGTGTGTGSGSGGSSGSGTGSGTNTDTGTDTLIVSGSFFSGNGIYTILSNTEAAYAGRLGSQKKITIPATVTLKISDDLKLKLKVTSIAKNALKRSDITSVKIGKNIKKIGSGAFAGCKKLKKITLPAAVTTIGSKAFQGDKKLKTITIKSKNLKKAGSKAFKGIYAKAVIKVPAKKRAAYRKLLKGKGQGKKVKIK